MTWLLLILFFTVDGGAAAQVATAKSSDECESKLELAKSSVAADHPPELAVARFVCIAVAKPQIARKD